MTTKDELIKNAKALINKEAAAFYNEREQQGVDYVITWAADFTLEQIAAERLRMFEELWRIRDVTNFFEVGRRFLLWFEREFAKELVGVKDGQ